MNKLSNFMKSTGDFLGNNIENICENTGKILCENLQKSNHDSIGRGIKSSGKLLGKISGITTKSVFNIAGISLEGGIKVSKFAGKVLKQKVVKEQVRVYGKSEVFYKDKFVEAEYKVLDKK